MSTPPLPKRTARGIALASFIAIIILAAIALLFIRAEKRKILHDKTNELEIISNLKVEQLLRWHRERLAEAEYFSGARPFSQYIQEIISGNSNNAPLFRENLRNFMRRNGYENILLADSSGKIHFSAIRENQPLFINTKRAIHNAYQAKTTNINDFFFCPLHQKVHYELVTPIFDQDGFITSALVFRIDPNEFIFPLLKVWPLSNQTGESILMRQEGDSVRLLSYLSNHINKELTHTIPLNDIESNYSRVTLQGTNTYMATDYRGERIIGLTKNVPGTNWIIIVKQDLEEILSPLRSRSAMIIILELLSFAITFSIAYWYYGYRRKQTLEEIESNRLKEEELRRILAETRSELLAYASKNGLEDTLRETLNKVGVITGSPLGFAHFFKKDQENIALTAWSAETERQFRHLIGKYTHSPVSVAGVWADAIRQKKTIIHNDFESVEGKKGYPPNHPQIIREIVVPVIREGAVVAALAISNKPKPYSSHDVFLTEFLADVVWEIAESKFKERELLESEKKYRTLFKEHSAPKLLVDVRSGKITDANPSAAQFYGYSSKELRNKEFISLLAPGSKSNGKTLEKIIAIKNAICEQAHLKSDGKLIHVRLYSSVIELGGKQFLHLIIHDITDKKQQEEAQKILYKITRNSMTAPSLESLLAVVHEELKRLLESDNFAVVLYDGNENKMKKLFFSNENESYEEWPADISMSGFVAKNGRSMILRKEEMIAFTRLHNLQLPPQIPECWAGVPMISEGKSLGSVIILSNSNPDAYDRNSLLLMEMVAHELALAVSRSIMIKDLIAAKEQAQQSDRLKTAFIGNISHEIKTPMNAIMGFVELLSDKDTLDEERETYINIIKEAGQRLTKTIGNLIEISKIEAGFSENEINTTNIPQFLSYVHALYLPQAQNKGLLFEMENSLPANFSIQTDQLKLEGIFQNLISNAIKFTPKGTITLRAKKEEHKVCFELSDTGIGIPVSKMEKLFKAFETLDYSLSREHQGAGLGLAIVKSYIDALGGGIEVTSKEGTGTTISFWIPARN